MKNINHLFAFAVKYPGWHTVADTLPDKRAVKWLVERGLVEQRGVQIRATIYTTENPRVALKLLAFEAGTARYEPRSPQGWESVTT